MSVTSSSPRPPVDADDRPFAMAVYSLPGIGPARSQRLRAECGSYAAAWQAPAAAYARLGLSAAQQAVIQGQRDELRPEALPELLRRHDLTAAFYGEAAYPRALTAMHDSPLVVYIRGEIESADQAACAVVGTRRASPYGRWMASRVAGGLARAGITIISGLAAGVDAAAHEAAVAAGGRTIGVLAGGLDAVYPLDNAALAGRMVAAGGALLSEYLPGTPTVAGNFLARNRLISGLALATVVIEAGRRSGALSTARFALEQGREVCAVPGRVGDPGSAGGHRLLRDGAHLIESAADVLMVVAPRAASLIRAHAPAGQATGPTGFLAVDSLPISGAGLQDRQAPGHADRGLAGRIVGLLRQGPLSEHRMLELIEVPASQIRATLALLELDRRIQRLPGASYVVLDTG